MGIGLGLFHNSLRKRVSVKRGAGVGVYLFFFRECCFRVRVMVMVRFRIRFRVSVNPNITLKQHSLKKDRPQSLVLLTPFANRFMDFYLSVH